MPIYSYQCADCGVQDQRVGGLDDHTALCVACGGLMLRLDEDLFKPYFTGQEEVREALDKFHTGLEAARRHLAEILP